MQTLAQLLPPAEIGTAQQEIPVTYINLSRIERKIVLREWRACQMYPMPKEVVQERIEEQLNACKLIR